tara:strand:- start:1979 stop:2821 length:843 start_codon:yes stop_codon:yes gene_type:complete
MNIQTLIRDGSLILKRNKIKSYKLDSEILMSKVISKDRKYVIMNPSEVLNNDSLKKYKILVKERSKGKPIAYMINKKYFWKYEFYISNEVLIPRPDTELIIDEALRLLKNRNNLHVLDIGIGSGCILLSILKEKKNFKGIGIDISKKCIEISKFNAENLGLKNRVKLMKTDVDNFCYGKYDLIISNPPYINKYDLKYLDRDVINFEPKLALDGGLDGLSEIRKTINKSSELIKKKGKFILEIAFDQKHKVIKLLKSKGFYINKVLKDFAKKDRCIVSTKI